MSSVYLVQLTSLMNTLHSTEPHFIRCIVPNTHKQPGGVEPPLIMHQLTCNGVLEGIRICMRGFPNRFDNHNCRQHYCCFCYSCVDTTPNFLAAKSILGFCTRISRCAMQFFPEEKSP